jgi:hypothetical protein
MTISMANDNYKESNMNNDKNKDKFRDNVNRRDNNNASQFNDKCNVNTNDNDSGDNDTHTYSTIVCSGAAISETNNDPKGIAAHILENYGVLLTTLKQFEKVNLSTTLPALPEALLKEPVSLSELTGDMDYVLSFEGDQGEGNGGPAQSSP